MSQTKGVETRGNQRAVPVGNDEVQWVNPPGFEPILFDSCNGCNLHLLFRKFWVEKSVVKNILAGKNISRELFESEFFGVFSFGLSTASEV